MAVSADDDVVVHGDAERFGGGNDELRHVDIGAAGRRVARGMIVDHPYGPHNVLIYMIYFA